MYLDVDGGRLAYEVTGTGPLIVLAHGIGDSRAAYRFVAPALVGAGYRVATVDLRGTGESSTTWLDYSRTAIAGDLLALVRRLGGPAVLVGHSISGGAVTIAAATAPGLVTALVQIAPFTRVQTFRFADLLHGPYRRAVWNLAGAALGMRSAWRRYLGHAYLGPRPADWSARLDRVEAMLREPGRTAALRQMLRTSPSDAGAHLAGVRCPVLVIEGSRDPDWVDPGAEGEAIVAALPDGLGEVDVVEGSGHYPHVQFPERVVTAILAHLSTVGARDRSGSA